MSDILHSVLAYFQQLPWLELIAMLLSIAYVMLAAKGSRWCWPAAFISTALYTVIFYDVLLLMDSALNAYYLFMAVYGYWQWSKQANNNQSENVQLTIVTWQLTWHIKVCFALALLAFGLGYLMDNYSPAHFPYLDTFTTVYAVFATYLVAKKVLENWLYWIVIDLASIYLYIEKGLIPTTILFVIFVVVAGYGYHKWLKLYQKSSVNLQSSATTNP
ncbi:nicotinamide riboside transporter PnuC [Colwellia psychrerythraea]|uniref:Nicotinamide riboside transporter PnuC n=1 Tax=Colwellia psychrerythraea TaxID=28229 RepID=A0A099KPS6_COLPS|nr:nicotinamide riboside transporter PnuC [Colwellia psychrerythraea]KGJ92506.1 nicotinamide mononucleotide transporter PnuC [Colwellia psychrerythraea]